MPLCAMEATEHVPREERVSHAGKKKLPKKWHEIQISTVCPSHWIIVPLPVTVTVRTACSGGDGHPTLMIRGTGDSGGAGHPTFTAGGHIGHCD